MLEQLVKKVDFSVLNILGILVENQLTEFFFFLVYFQFSSSALYVHHHASITLF